MRISEISARVRSAFDLAPALRPAALGAVAVMMSLAPAAHAVVVVSPASNIVVPATTTGVYINVVSGVFSPAPASAPGWDINPWSSTVLSFFNPATPTGGVYVMSGATVAALAAGATIGPASTYGSGTTTFAAGGWALNSTNYFGFRFIGDDALLHYGYATMIVGATATVRSVGQIFYESVANTPITISAVPEASTWAMMLLGGAALAGSVARRRRQEAA